MQQKVEMEMDKETKGTVRYAEKGDPAGHVFGTVYVKKGAFKEGTAYPREIEVTIKSVE